MPDNVETVALEEEQYAQELNISNASYGAASYYYRNLRHPNNYSAEVLLQERRQIALSQANVSLAMSCFYGACVHEGRTGPNGTNYTEPVYDPCEGLGFVETVRCEAKQFFKELAVISGMALPYEYPDLPKYAVSPLDNTGTGTYSRE
jgi:hypothetical protein